MRSIRRVYAALAVFALLWAGCTAAVFAQPVDAISAVRARMKAATVRVWCELEDGRGFGSGVLVNHEGHPLIVTNHHVVEGYRGVPRYAHAGGKWIAAPLLVTDEKMDLAVLRAADQLIGTCEVARFWGDLQYTACGYAGDGKWHSHPLKAKQWTGIGPHLYSWVDFHGSVCLGDSGGPIFNSAGRVVGVVWGKTDDVVTGVCGIPFRNILAKAAEVR